jgi:hypothetical protein
MSRNRGFTSLNECINPIYFDVWGHFVTVKECIRHCFFIIKQKAYRRISQHGHVNLILHDFTTTSRETVGYIHQLCMELVTAEKDIEIIIGTEKWNKNDIVVKFVPFSLQRGKYCIPVGWQDNEKDYSWQQVIDNPQYYSSSSTDVWPPLEYQKLAHLEKINQMQQKINQMQQKINQIQQTIAAHN